MWRYDQKSGSISLDGFQHGIGYSGHGEGKNNPLMEAVHEMGPIPRGTYEIGPPHNTVTHGPYVMSLTPNRETNTLGRSGFLIHGDSIEKPGTASRGCIILSRVIRQEIWESGDHEVEVV